MPNHLRPSLPTISLEAARRLRRETTDAERKLWTRLRAGQLAGVRFRRQHPIPPFVVDFYSDSAKLVVELDGSQHGDDFDRSRTLFLQNRGLDVLRFWDNDVLKNTDAVLEAILDVLAHRPLTPTPLPQGEGP